jgi:hemerythrin-like domain-containing protein
MCEYCGCQHNDVIAELTAQHDRLRDLSRDLTEAVNSADLPTAITLAAQMQSVLRPHTQVEEVGLFPALAADYGNHLDQLVAEHRDIDAALDDSPRGALSPAGSFARNSPSPTSSITSSRSKTASFPRP